MIHLILVQSTSCLVGVSGLTLYRKLILFLFFVFIVLIVMTLCSINIKRHYISVREPLMILCANIEEVCELERCVRMQDAAMGCL